MDEKNKDKAVFVLTSVSRIVRKMCQKVKSRAMERDQGRTLKRDSIFECGSSEFGQKKKKKRSLKSD
jgi:hypothetical protein